MILRNSEEKRCKSAGIIAGGLESHGNWLAGLYQSTGCDGYQDHSAARLVH